MKLGPYELGPNDTPENGIYTGDARKLLRDVPADSIDAIISDPPFKLSQVYTKNVDADNLLAVSSIWPIASHWYRVARPGAFAAVYYDTRILPVVIAAMGEAQWKYLRGLTFYRRWGSANKLYGWMSTSDFILVFYKPADEPMEFHSNDWRHDVYLKVGPEDNDLKHVAQKPLNDVRHLVRHLCPSDGLVLDSYCGTGTTAQAARMECHKYLAFEIDPDTAERARERVRNTQPPLFTIKPEQIPLSVGGDDNG